MASDDTEMSGDVQCPVCSRNFDASKINAHLDRCLISGDGCVLSKSQEEDGPPLKKSRASADAVSSQSVNNADSVSSHKRDDRRSATSPLFSMFQMNKNRSLVQNERNTSSLSPDSVVSKGIKRNSPVESESSVSALGQLLGEFDNDAPALNGPMMKTSKSKDVSSLTSQTIDKPLAEQMRPTTLQEYFGQNKVVGQHTLLRSLLDSPDIPSLILWGPPGCGKTTLAHIIASNMKKNGSARFVTLSATSTSTSEVREVIKQARNELRLCKRKTILFIDEIHRFNKSQQDTFLPHVECGTVTLIGATTENPSFQVNAALLSRCRVLVLEKLSVEAMRAILHRAIASLGISELGPDLDAPGDQDVSDGSEPRIYIEQKALDTIAHLCDGDARAGLNSLQLAVQARVGVTGPGGRPQEIVIQEDHVKEGLQRSHILYDKAGEEHYNCISALHKSMRGSHENASLYWLGRMLEGGEEPLYVARRLVRFASEDVGMADPAALPQAVSAFQACHFIGMPECEVILAQCVVYLARAPKSVEIYKAYNNVKASLRTHRGPLPSVPLHLRNAPTKLMKELGYAKGYKYNPSFSAPVEQDYLPEELRGIDFFTWTPT